MNKNLVKFALIFACLLCLTFSAPAQRRKTRKRTIPAKTAAVDKNQIKQEAEKVSIQIKNTTKFLYNLGGIAKGIEDIDKAVRDKKASREVAAQNNQFKRDVLQSIRNLRAGLIALEIDFRTEDELKPFLLKIQGISDISGRAEDYALNGQFDESGKTLLIVVEKLADTLAAMP